MPQNIPQPKNLPLPKKTPSQEGIVPATPKPKTNTQPTTNPKNKAEQKKGQPKPTPEKKLASKVSAQQAQEVSQKTQQIIMSGFLWTMLLGLALLKDVLEILLNFIPVAGGFLAFILTLPCTMIIYIILFQKGILSLWKNTGRLVSSISCLIADNVPMINFLPVTTLNVAVLMFSSAGKKVTEKVKTKAKETVSSQSKSAQPPTQETPSGTSKPKQTAPVAV